MGIEIGKFDRRVKFESPAKSPDGAGGQTEQFNQWITTWANIKPISGFRNYNEGYESAVARYDIRVYWNQNISNNVMKGTKVVFDNVVAVIDSMLPKDEGGKKIFHLTVTATH